MPQDTKKQPSYKSIFAVLFLWLAVGIVFGMSGPVFFLGAVVLVGGLYLHAQRS